MHCLECSAELERLDHQHLQHCCGLTLQEYAIRHHMPLDLLLSTEQINGIESTNDYVTLSDKPSSRAQTLLSALRLSQSIQQQGEFSVIEHGVRRLEQLLCYLQCLRQYGFQFRQEYSYDDNSHRVIAKNRLKTPSDSLIDTMPAVLDHVLFSAVLLAEVGEFHAGYVFLRLPKNVTADDYIEGLRNNFQIRCIALDAVLGPNKGPNHGASQEKAGAVKQLYRTESLEDAHRLLKLVEPELALIPCASERFYADVPVAMISKELVFDSAHFISDHPGKCENLHGGRYNLQVKIEGRIDPLDGFVIDYGYLKSVVKHRVIDQLDHQTLNYVNCDLAWRSSTELLNVFIWEQLIDYLPGLLEVQTYETTQSYCVYRGPKLEDMQTMEANGPLKYFSNQELGRSSLRKLLENNPTKKLQLVND